ncbi:hypothetical protein R6Q59_006123 [Mikania micrantha]
MTWGRPFQKVKKQTLLNPLLAEVWSTSSAKEIYRHIVIETLTVPRAAIFPAASLNPIVSSLVSQLSLHQNFVPESKSSKLNINREEENPSIVRRSSLRRRKGVTSAATATGRPTVMLRLCVRG